jgi:hypothetical protein
MWIQSRTLFVTINVPGGSNNDADVWYGAPAASPAQLAEIDERTGATLRWLDLAFAVARGSGLDGVVIEVQPIVRSIATHTTQLGRPLLLLNGDSHVYLSDNPLSASDPLAYMHPGYDVANFHRIVVHGSTLPLEWLKLTIDPQKHAPNRPDAFGPFAWRRITG